MPTEIKTWLDFAFQQMAAESYLDQFMVQGVPLQQVLVDGNNDRRVVSSDLFTGMTRFVNLAGVPNANEVVGSTQAFAARYQIVDHHANDAMGFSATLMRDTQTGAYTLAFRSVEYQNQAQGGDWERDGQGGAAERGTDSDRSKMEGPICVNFRRRVICTIAWALLLSPAVVFGESYTLVLGKAEAVCRHMLRLFNDDLKYFGELNYGQHEEFAAIGWTMAIEDYCRRVQLAQIDIDNDGHDDTVLKDEGCLRGTLSDSLYIYAEGKNAPVPSPKFVFDGAMAKLANGVIWKSRGGSYELRKLPKFREGTFQAYQSIGSGRGFRINPFGFGGKYYVVLDNPFQVLKNGRRFTAIAKYEKNGQLNDLCYLSTTIRGALNVTD